MIKTADNISCITSNHGVRRDCVNIQLLYYRLDLKLLLQSIICSITIQEKQILQGWKFSDFSLISDFFTATIQKIIFEISSYDRVSSSNIIDPDYQKKSLYYFRLFH